VRCTRYRDVWYKHRPMVEIWSVIGVDWGCYWVFESGDALDVCSFRCSYLVHLLPDELNSEELLVDIIVHFIVKYSTAT